MGHRVTKSTENKKIAFSYEGDYYFPGTDKKEFFKNKFSKNSPYIVAYTTVITDCGTKEETSFGIPCLVKYDNGYIGCQSFQAFNNAEEARKDYELKKKLTAKPGIKAYCDVFLIDLTEKTA